MGTTALTTQIEHIPTVHKSIFLDMERFANAQRVGQLLAASSLVPEAFRGNIANCVIALNLADRLQVDPFMMMQNMYVVHGRPGIEGKMAIALIEGTGRYSAIKFKFTGEGKTEKGVPRPGSCVAYATELKSGEVIEGPPVTWEMAVAEGWTKPKKDSPSKWHTMPDLMFRYRAAMFFARVNCPGALLGLRTIEEIEDIEMVQVGNGTYESKDAPFDAIKPDDRDEKLKQFDVSIPQDTDMLSLESFISEIAKKERAAVEDVKIEAMKQPTAFWGAFSQYDAKFKKMDEKTKQGEVVKKPEPEPEHEERWECPNGGWVTASVCNECKDLTDKDGNRCPAAPAE